MSFTLDASIQQLEAIRLGDGPSRKITIEHVRADIIIGWIRQRDRISRNTGKTVDLVPRISGKTRASIFSKFQDRSSLTSFHKFHEVLSILCDEAKLPNRKLSLF